MREKTFKNFFIRNSRSIILVTFYVLAFFLSGFFSPSVAYSYRNTRICIHYSHTSFAYLFQVIFIFLFFFPLLYYFLLATTCMSKFFGGSADPILGKLTDQDLARARLIKQVTLLKCLIEFFTEIHSSSYLYLPTFLFEVLRFFGFVAILATTFIFYRHENFVAIIKERFFGGGVRGSQQTPDVARRSNFIFRGQRTNEDASTVDYSNLVENEN